MSNKVIAIVIVLLVIGAALFFAILSTHPKQWNPIVDALKKGDESLLKHVKEGHQ